MELLIKGARIIDSNGDFVGDVYIKDGVISQLGESLEVNCSTILGKGYTLLPSFIDLHCHFRDPGLTHKEDLLTGSRAAIKGGYTAVNLMANTNPVCSSMEVINLVLEKSKNIDMIDIHQTMSITEDMKGESISHLEKPLQHVKFISDDGRGVQNSALMLEAMFKAKEKGLTVISHAENEDLAKVSSRLSENVMTWRDITLAKYTGCRLHMAHVSTKESMEYVMEGKQKGVNITCEVAPHHLYFTDDRPYKVNPPFRKQEDINFIIECIKNDYVDAIATDHAPHTEADKENGAPGISGLETAFSVCYSSLVKNGHITLNKLSRLMSKVPAELLGLNKGLISIGYDGDLVLVDTEKEITVDTEEFYSKGKNSPFNKEVLYGEVVATIKAGKVLYNSKSVKEEKYDYR